MKKRENETKWTLNENKGTPTQKTQTNIKETQHLNNKKQQQNQHKQNKKTNDTMKIQKRPEAPESCARAFAIISHPRLRSTQLCFFRV